jgi:hypothetical protein
MPFVKGQSGNPGGRPLGARNKQTLAIEALLEASAEEMVDLAVERARAGSSSALRICIDRILPRVRDRPVPFVLPRIVTAADAAVAVTDIQAAVGTGEITIPEALGLMQIVEKSVSIVAAARAKLPAGAEERVAAGPERAVDDVNAAVGAGDLTPREAVDELRGVEQSARMAGAGRRGSNEPTQETMKYNEPPEPADGTAAAKPQAATGHDGERGGAQETTKYNGAAVDCTPVVRREAGSGSHGQDHQTHQETEITMKYNERPEPASGVGEALSSAENGPDHSPHRSDERTANSTSDVGSRPSSQRRTLVLPTRPLAA